MVARLERCVGGLEGDAVARLVAHRPDNHRRVVLVAFEHSCCPLNVGIRPFRLISKGRFGVAAVAVRLDVGLVHEVEAELIGELVPAWVVGVVRGAHRVDVVLLHQLNILNHRCLIDHMTRDGIGLVTIDASDGDGYAVDQQLAIRNLHRSKADLEAHHLAIGFGRALEIENDGVELGGLRGPTPNRADVEVERDRFSTTALDDNLGSPEGRFTKTAGIVEQRSTDRSPSRLIGVVAKSDGEFEASSAIFRAVEVGYGEIVTDVDLR